MSFLDLHLRNRGLNILEHPFGSGDIGCNSFSQNFRVVTMSQGDCCLQCRSCYYQTKSCCCLMKKAVSVLRRPMTWIRTSANSSTIAIGDRDCIHSFFRITSSFDQSCCCFRDHCLFGWITWAKITTVREPCFG